MATGWGGCHIIFAKFTLNLPYIFLPKKSYFPIYFLSRVAWHPETIVLSYYTGWYQL